MKVMAAEGRGFIAVALVYFGRWSPWGVAAGAAIFSLAGAAQRLIQFYGIKFPYELALIIPYVLVIVVLACSRNRSRVDRHASVEARAGIGRQGAPPVDGTVERLARELALRECFG